MATPQDTDPVTGATNTEPGKSEGREESGTMKSRLWTRSFVLLWQGQLVSSIGDVVYGIALGFWVLAVTGSTALMGTLMAAAMLPRVLLGPFAGAWVDRTDRRWLLVTMDSVRGAVVLGVGAAAVAGVLQIWMVFVAGIIIGMGAAVFNPSILSAVPDIVSPERLVQGNSFFQMIGAASGILGNSVGGGLYALIGAPVLFLVNGVSYLFSAASAGFVRIPNRHRAQGRVDSHFLTDLRDGFTYVWSTRGLRTLLLFAGVTNFFVMIAVVLMMPLFQRTAGLGPAAYGIAMATMTGGMLLGMLATAAAPIPASRRVVVFSVALGLFIASFALFPQFHTLPPMLVALAIGGFADAIVGVLMMSIIQLSTPAHLRGKVMGLLDTLTQGLTPVGMAVGGILGQYLPLPLVMSASFAVIAVVVVPGLLLRDVRDFFVREPPDPPGSAITSSGG